MKHKLLLLLLLMSENSAAITDKYPVNEGWGVGIGVRSANILFDTDDKAVHDVIPLLFFQGENFYLNGSEGGYNFFQSDNFSAGVVAKIRYFDIPKRYQNDIQGTQVDFGGKVTWHSTTQTDLSAEVLSDKNGRIYTTLTGEYSISDNHWDVSPYVQLTAKTEKFNNTYYGLQTDDIGAGVNYTLGIKGRYQLYDNLYAVAHGSGTLLDSKIYHSDFINSRSQWESYIGLSLFNRPGQRTHSQLPTNSYIRLAGGVATTSGVFDIFTLNNKTDPQRNTMTSLFYGHPIADNIFGWPIDFYLTPGFIQHHKSDVQGQFGEYVVAIKGYYTFDWPTTWRFGFGEGISYSTKISHIENERLSEKGYKPSKLMNYLDFSLDVNVGQLLNNNSLSSMWLGYSLHHRSGIFTQSSAFGRIKGGSDYNTLYVQWDF